MPTVIPGSFEQTLLGLTKGALLLLFFLHLLFSIILVRQTKTMTEVIEARISPVIFLVSIVHLIASGAVFLGTLLFF